MNKYALCFTSDWVCIITNYDFIMDYIRINKLYIHYFSRFN